MTSDNPKRLRRESFADGEPEGSGLKWWDFINAVQMWALCQQRDVTIGEAAKAFNVEANLIQQAVLESYWLDYARLAGTPIEAATILMDGE